MREVWNYYKDQAERGSKYVVNGMERKSPYSILWFYDSFDERQLEKSLNPLTRAFLGEEVAYEALHPADEETIRARRDSVAQRLKGEKQQPNAAQISAIANVLSNPVTLVQGPPGTGKTETIKNLLLCLMDLDPVPTVAVVSSNRKAIQNIVEKAEKHPDLCSKYAHLGNLGMRKTFWSDHEEFAVQLPWDSGDPQKFVFPADLLKRYPIVFSTIHSLNKCIHQSGTGYFQYDYVIVDECSQVGSTLGILAMSAAKHLALIGDREQLPPVFQEDRQDHPLEAKVKSYYLDQGDNSFMTACEQHFGEKAGQVLLNEHYRCHPAIIGFCNEVIYGNRLIVRQEDDHRLPIRVRWYEGDYWERVPGKKPGKLENCNRRQIQVFMEDELPLILRRGADFKGVRVLSPYRRQLELLQEEINAYNQRKGSPLKDVSLAEEDPLSPDVPELTMTVHKAQGAEFDLVYILPVQDTGKNPWGQRKDLINVAVSRAVRELCVITSAAWAPPEVQKQQLGYVANTGWLDRSNLYLAQLLDYVHREEAKRTVAPEFGFQRASVRSVFDKNLYYKGISKLSKQTLSAPARCMQDALREVVEEQFPGQLTVYREVPLKNVEGISSDDPEIREYIDNNARFDFVVCGEDRVYLIVEVDGEYHRKQEENMANDGKKDRAVASLGEEFYAARYLRFPTDGTARGEKERVAEVLAAGVERERLPRLLEVRQKVSPSVREQLVDYFDQTLDRAVETIRPHLTGGGEMDDDLREAMGILSYEAGRNPGEGYKDELLNACYLFRFGYAYAFEYAYMYERVLRHYRAEESKRGPILGVTSFGCGSMIDAWSLAYAKAKLEEEEPGVLPENLSLRYAGVDMRRWPFMFRFDKEPLGRLYSTPPQS